MASSPEPPPSLPFAFIGGALDRASWRRRDDVWLAEVRLAEETRVVVVRGASELLVADGPRLNHLAPGRLPEGAELTFLGIADDGTAVFAFDAGADMSRRAESDAGADALLADATFGELRSLAADLAPHEAGLGAHAVAMVGWHRRHRYCGACGTLTEFQEAGHSRKCPSCGAQHFPRTDPAVIMLVTDGERCVLGKRPGLGRWTVLAGFVEPGETLEAAVAREVHEEVGLRVIDVSYIGSQPWPFPANLMLGFRAQAAYGELKVDEELDDARWFSRQELRASINSGAISTPASVSIASHLIRSWLEEGPPPGP
jgi:NAD+ diphosphatase